jgi:hypothetical protein
MLHASQHTINHLHIPSNRIFHSRFHIRHTRTPKRQYIRTITDQLLGYIAHDTKYLFLRFGF